LHIQYDARRSSTFKGYNPLKSENNDPNNDGDLHEGWNIGFEGLDPGSKDALDGGWKESAMAGKNVWPEEGEVANFRKRVLTY
jgi:isopenicillin N synthase-like dioxygenase